MAIESIGNFSSELSPEQNISSFEHLEILNCIAEGLPFHSSIDFHNFVIKEIEKCFIITITPKNMTSQKHIYLISNTSMNFNKMLIKNNTYFTVGGDLSSPDYFASELAAIIYSNLEKDGLICM